MWWIYALNNLATSIKVNRYSQVIKAMWNQRIGPREKKMQRIQVNDILTDMSTGCDEWMTWPVMNLEGEHIDKRHGALSWEGQQCWSYFKRLGNLLGERAEMGMVLRLLIEQ